MKTLKIVSGITLFIFLLISCGSSKSINSNESDITKISLEKSAMGGLFKMEINEKELHLDSKSIDGSDEAGIGNVTPEVWKKINDLIRKLDLNQMENWPAPTHDYAFDGARASSIHIERNGKIFTSQTFDEGRPPKELKELYDYLESLVNQ